MLRLCNPFSCHSERSRGISNYFWLD